MNSDFFVQVLPSQISEKTSKYQNANISIFGNVKVNPKDSDELFLTCSYLDPSLDQQIEYQIIVQGYEEDSLKIDPNSIYEVKGKLLKPKTISLHEIHVVNSEFSLDMHYKALEHIQEHFNQFYQL